MTNEQQYIELFSQNRDVICAKSVQKMNVCRDEAFKNFMRLGFPTRKVERYKYIDVASLFAPNYGVNLQRLTIPTNPKDLFSCSVPKLSTLLYYVVNDSLYQNQPNTSLPEGVIIDSSTQVYAKNADLIDRYYGRLASTKDDAITALNTMIAQDGLLIYVPKNTRIEKTVQVLNVLNADVDLMANRRVLIILEDGAQAQLLFCDHAIKNNSFLTTQVVEVFVGRGAHLDLYCLEETHIKNVRFSNLYINQEADSVVNHNQITLHNGVTRNRTDLVFAGEGAECQLNGCVIADKHQFVDNNTLIDHRVGHCTSNELYKYVLNDESVGAFAGRVLVREGSQQTVSQETNQNLCASTSARMFTQPMLEIYADDVKCSHGSTVGQLNDAALFYMRQRGIPEREARLLLEHAFINEVIEKMQIQPLRDRLSHLVEMRFRGKLNVCEGCKLCK